MPRIRTAVVAIAAPLATAVAALALAGCGSAGSAANASRPGAAAVTGAGLQGLVLKPARPAPALALRDYTGRFVDLAALRGRPVFVTFVYTRCPDVCPLIVANLANAQRQLGRAGARMLAVTVDPRRDTPAAIRAFLAAHNATGRLDYLLGSGAQLRRTWKAWDVAVETSRTNRVTAGHSAIVYGIGASGRMEVVYPSDFSPAQIVHDVPLLARG